LFSLVLSESYRMIVVCSKQYISLCTKAYKDVKLLPFCVTYDEKKAHEYLINQRRK
jgi:hypothetical protein